MEILPQLIFKQHYCWSDIVLYMRPILTTSRSIKLAVPAGAEAD